jgi:hypothetical protein
MIAAQHIVAAAEDSGCSSFTHCTTTRDGIEFDAKVGAQRHEDASAADLKPVSGRESESRTTPGCPSNDPNVADATMDLACGYMTSFCPTHGLGDGWLVWSWTRPLHPDGTAAGPWTRTGSSCVRPQDVTAHQPALTRALVQRAFRRLTFAHPRLHVQPEGNITLVNLPTYYQVTWPAEGFEPGEVASVELLGRSVQLRPKAVSYTYDFGDGASTGPTSDPGGRYPDGGIRHVYRDTAQVPVSAQVLYTGDYAVDGGAWEPIDLTVPVAGDAVTVQVKQARGQLEAGRR